MLFGPPQAGRIISTHAPAGGATFCYFVKCGIYCISTHAPAGGATRPVKNGSWLWFNFYSRPCGRGDYKYNKALFEKLAFLLTPLREGRHSYLLIFHTYTPNFYSRPCGRGDLLALLAFLRAAFISTHAPAGGATLICWLCFRYDIISTHAPAGGATWYSGHCYTIIQSHFYSRPCGRGDGKPKEARAVRSSFLLTPLREGRLNVISSILPIIYFYSRPCGRGDLNRL